jgi:hypothetical protein
MVRGLLDIAKAQFGVGNPSAAYETLEEALAANEEGRRDSRELDGWHYAVSLLASIGDFARAHEIAAMIDLHDARGEALRQISYRQTMSDGLAEAKRWASQLKDPNERGEAFLGIAEGLGDQLKALNARGDKK